MAMNKSKGNMYGFVDYTWNTIKGECPHGCEYCYMKQYAKQKPVRFDAKELDTDLGAGNTIFVGSSCDMFAHGIHKDWIEKTLHHCQVYDENKYLFQTKNPANLMPYRSLFPDESTFCVTVESDMWHNEMGLAPTPAARIEQIGFISRVLAWDVMITIEPVMDFEPSNLAEMITGVLPEQVNIGANSRHGDVPLREPSREKLLDLIDFLKLETDVHLKKNLRRILGDVFYTIKGVERQG